MKSPDSSNWLMRPPGAPWRHKRRTVERFPENEAMSCSLPCAVTDVGGNADLVRNDVTGFVVPLDNSRQLAANMLRLMHLDPEQRKIMGIKGRRFVQSEHDLSLVAARWRDLYGSWSA